MESVKVKCGAENRGIVQNSIHETIKPLQVGFQVSIPYPSGGKQEVSSLESAHVFPPPHPTLPKNPQNTVLPVNLYNTILWDIDYEASHVRWECSSMKEGSQFKWEKDDSRRNIDKIGVSKAFPSLQIKTMSSEKKWLFL